MPEHNPNQPNDNINHKEEISDNDKDSDGDEDETRDRDGEEQNADPEDIENHINLEDSIYSQRTKSGRITKLPKKCRDYVTDVIDKQFRFMLIGAGTGERINIAMQLHVKNFKDAMMTPDKSNF